MVFQDPSTSLHPMLSVSAQLTDHLRHHLGPSRSAAAARSNCWTSVSPIRQARCAATRTSSPAGSGSGSRHIARLPPRILIADEPTTALDVTVQAGVLHLLRDLASEMGLAVLLVTHDLGVMSAVADRVAVMRHGEVVENGERHQVFTAPTHTYTASLLASLPGATGGVQTLDDVRALEAQ
jgi:ABC-type dipeptide/oligopeptide/nickel transport system ATPase component